MWGTRENESEREGGVRGGGGRQLAWWQVKEKTNVGSALSVAPIDVASGTWLGLRLGLG